MKVGAAFQRLLAKIAPVQGEVNRVLVHGGSIKSRLDTSFRLRKFMKVGSHARGTAIRGFSDIDFFAVLARDDARWGKQLVSSATFLENIRRDLIDRYPNTTVSRDGQAAVVHFAGGHHQVDVVPAIFQGFGSTKAPIYRIPDGYGGWLSTSPESHNRFIGDADARSGGKLYRTAKLFKFWRECRSPRIPISSFHIELVLSGSA